MSELLLVAGLVWAISMAVCLEEGMRLVLPRSAEFHGDRGVLLMMAALSLVPVLNTKLALHIARHRIRRK